MAPPCLYLDMYETGVSAIVFPFEENQQPVSIVYDDIKEIDNNDSCLKTALPLLAEKIDLSNCKHAIVLVPGSWISFRYTSLPFANDNKIKQVLPLELDACLPQAESDFLTDFSVLKQRFEPAQHLIFSASISEHKMEALFQDLSSMGIAPKMVTPRGYAQAKVFMEQDKALTDLLYVHACKESYTLTLFKDSLPLAVRSVRISTIPSPDVLAREIQTILTSAWLRAGMDATSLAAISIFIQQSYDMALDSKTDVQALTDRTNEKLEQIKIADQQIPNARTQEHQAWYHTISANRLPDSLFNFCFGKYKTDSFLTLYKYHVAVCLILLFVSFSLAVFNLYQQNNRLEGQIKGLRQASMEIYKQTFPKAGSAPIPAPLMLMESKLKQARKNRSNGGTDEWKAGAQIRVMEILNDLSSKIPNNIDLEITRLVLNHGRLIISGITNNYNSVDTIKSLIQASPRFKSVTINSAEAEKNENHVRFKFILEL